MDKATFDQYEVTMGVRKYGTEEKNALMDVLNTGLISSIIGGKYTKKFEDEFAKFHGVKHAMALSSAMSGLHTGLIAAGVTAGSEVICDSVFAFGPISVLYNNAIPVFADINPITHNMDPDKIEDVIKSCSNVKAILVTHAWGLPAEMDKITNIAKKYKLKVVEDCAEAILATYKGRYVGTWGDVGSFSFQASKQMSTGDSGMAITDDDEIIGTLRSFGGAPTTHSAATIGLRYNYRINELTAAFGLSQFMKLPEFIKKLQLNASYYNNAAEGCKFIKIQRGPDEAVHTYYHWAATFHGDDNGITQDDLIKALTRYGVKSVSIGYTNMPPYKQPLFKEKLAHAFHCKDYTGKNNNYPDGLCPVAEKTIPNIVLAYIFGEEEYVKKETERFHKALNSLK
ncbi:MAG: DegT/DnrJ/EryC1/StrS family aminotransferase [Actinobacteria bacterium]|nr:DegT/DnrJ/EryC1/StrS family aminotransferase [Actinomycetota bacterium]